MRGMRLTHSSAIPQSAVLPGGPGACWNGWRRPLAQRCALSWLLSNAACFGDRKDPDVTPIFHPAMGRILC